MYQVDILLNNKKGLLMYKLKTKLHEREKNYKVGNLRSIALDVTSKCNMKCKFCYAETFAKSKPIELDILKKALDEAYEMGVCHYILQGGEVCADFERLKDIISLIYPEETYINIVSNGWGMSLERIQELKKLQVDKITFSLDSGIEEEHDSNRMLGSFKKVKEAINYVLEEGLLAGISTVVTHNSLYSEGFQKSYEYAKEKDIRFDVQIAEPVGKWDGNKEELITKQDAQYIKELYEKSPIMKNGQKMIKRDLYRGTCDCCPAGTEFMAITVDGNFMPCNFIQATLGNIKDKTLTEMRNDLLKSKWFLKEYPYCILGESDEYFDEIVKPNIGKKKPLDAYEIFELSKE